MEYKEGVYTNCPNESHHVHDFTTASHTVNSVCESTRHNLKSQNQKEIRILTKNKKQV